MSRESYTSSGSTKKVSLCVEIPPSFGEGHSKMPLKDLDKKPLDTKNLKLAWGGHEWDLTSSAEDGFCGEIIIPDTFLISTKTYKPTKEENNMSNLRRVVTVQLIDDDQGLPVESSLVMELTGIVTEDDDSTTIQEILMDHDIGGKLEIHNKKRSGRVNKEIQGRTGQEVYLNPVKLKDLRWVVR